MTLLKLNGFLTGVILFATSLNVFAQSDATTGSAVGIKGGFNASNLYTDEVDDQNLLPGFHLGVFAKAAITEYIAFQPELLFSTKGAKLKYDNDFFEGEATFTLSYIELPILLKLNLTKNINVHAGPYIATLAAVKIKNESSSDFFDFEDELDKEDFETLDYGLVAGVGLDFDRLSLGLRYDYGLMKVGKERTFLGQSYRIPDASNSTIQIYAGINLF